jgi:hypothetical protein
MAWLDGVGIARNTEEAIRFLNACESVTDHFELNEEWIQFAYLPSIDAASIPADLVWLDVRMAPDEAFDAFEDFYVN